MENSISSDLIRGHIDTIILYSLIDSDKNAQQISDYVLEKSNKQYEMNQATLYSSLKRLEKLVYIKAYWNDSPDGRRRFFKLLEKGKKFVDANLENWSFSRSIIDKLLDAKGTTQDFVIQQSQQQTNLQVEQIEPEITVDNNTMTNQDFYQEKAINNLNIEKNIEQNEYLNIDENIANIDKSNNENCNFEISSEKELNFRNILNGLVKTTKIIEEEPIIDKEQPVVSVEKEKLIEVIEQKSINEKVISKCNIDFGDLEINASKNGYKIRFSNSKQSRTKGKILVNFINFFSSFIVSLIALFEFLIISKFIAFNTALNAFCGIVCGLPVIICLFMLVIKPKRTKSFLKSNAIVTFLIIFFDFTLLTFVIEWLMGIDFTVTFDLICYYILPVAIYFNIFLFVYIRYLLSKTKMFISKK